MKWKSNKSKFWALIAGLMLWAIIWFTLGDLFELDIMFGSINAVNFIAVTPIFCIFLGELISGRPLFIKNYIEEVVNRDSERGAFSIHTLGLVMFVLAPLIIYFIFAQG